MVELPMLLTWLRCTGVLVYAVDNRNDFVGISREYSIQAFIMHICEGRFVEGFQVHDAVADQMFDNLVNEPYLVGA
jgi:hypothetical protein